jgi:hypothetical protein
VEDGVTGSGHPGTKRQITAGVALYDATGRPLAMTSTMAYVKVTPPAVIKSLQTGHVQGEFLRQADLSLHVLALPISAEARLLGAIAIFHKVGFTGALLWAAISVQSKLNYPAMLQNATTSGLRNAVTITLLQLAITARNQRL